MNVVNTLNELERLLSTLRLELEVAPTDIKAHQATLQRIAQVASNEVQNQAASVA